MLPLLILTTALFFATPCLGDELISARCQAKCLQDMEHRLQDNAEQKRNLKHHIIQMCKDDATCSACAAPCREGFTDAATCKSQTCSDSLDKAHCEESCDFLQRIYTEKPGACPRMTNASNYECSALCHLDGDCGETLKCCSYGCSRQCVLPRGRDPRLLPVPTAIAVQERKRRRSINIRWVMQKMTREQTNSNSNLFVVQWRWGLHTDAMTEWQTVTVRNKPYAILKHLLSPGRFYQFRVGAVGVQGSLGFSKPSEPFKMSTEARAPHPPRDIALGAAKLTPIGLWNQQIQWTSPLSDLPIKNYQVSWAASSAAEADSFEDQMRRRAILATHDKRDAEEEDDQWGIESRDRHTVLVPSHATSAEISGLFPNSVYIVEVHASVESTEGELQGEKGIIFVRTGDALNGAAPFTTSTTEPTTSQETATSTEATEENHEVGTDSDSLSITMPGGLPDIPGSTDLEQTEESEIDIQTPIFEEQLQTGISWLNSRLCGPGRSEFIVRFKKGLCREYQPHQILTDASRWTDIVATECSATLTGLSFDCDYEIQVYMENSQQHMLTGRFSTVDCGSTPSRTPIPCTSITTPIVCKAHAHHVMCTWSRDSESIDTVIGYRVILTSTSKNAHNITINPPQLREVFYQDLIPGDMYKVEVQAITNKGMGRVVTTNFVAPSHFGDDSLLDRFPGGEIIELPLESSMQRISTMFSFIFSILLCVVL